MVLEILAEETSISEIAVRETISRTRLQNWKKEFIENSVRVFSQSKIEKTSAARVREAQGREQSLMVKVGQLTLEVDWLKKNLPKYSEPTGRANLVSKTDKLTVKRQCKLIGQNRTSVYYTPTALTPEALEREELIKAKLDFWHTKQCCLGVRDLKKKLCKEEGFVCGRKLVTRYMAEMGIRAVYPKPNLSKYKQHKAVAYLLRNLSIFLPNQVWAIDITYIKMGKSHMYLTAIIDWYSHFIVGWALSDTLDTAPVLDLFSRAIAAYGTPSIIKSDQGCRFTSDAYIGFLKSNQICQSMDDKARWVDNVIIERWFRTLKCENIYINEYNTPKELHRGIRNFILLYNTQRPHTEHGRDLPLRGLRPAIRRLSSPPTLQEPPLCYAPLRLLQCPALISSVTSILKSMS